MTVGWTERVWLVCGVVNISILCVNQLTAFLNTTQNVCRAKGLLWLDGVDRLVVFQLAGQFVCLGSRPHSMAADSIAIHFPTYFSPQLIISSFMFYSRLCNNRSPQ